MKGKLLPLTAVVLTAMFNTHFNAQQYQTMPIQSGFNADVIANGIGSSTVSTNNDVDGVSYAFVSQDFQLTAADTPLTYGLPTSGLITSVVPSPAGLTYEMASYSANNSLRLETAGENGTFTFTTPKAAVNLYMLATGGSGACTVDVTVNFSDASTQTFSSVSISDWYDGSNFAIQGIGRIKNTNDILESSSTNPRLYQIPLAIDAANQSKMIQSVTITKTGAGGIPNIFAFSAEIYNACYTPTNVMATTTMNGVTVDWTAPASAPSSGYQYYLSTSATPPTATTAPTGNLAAGSTSTTLNNLSTGQTYYFWIRSNCGGSSQSYWTMTQFTPGQISATYTAGDLSTMYDSSFNITTTSTTPCPGTLTVSIPAGYKIKSTAVSYTMSTVSNGYMSEQRSFLVCNNNNISEASVTSGVGGTTGTYSYNRTGLDLANDLTGNVDFELRAWRTYGDSSAGCTTTYNKVDNNTFKVTVTLEALQLATSEVGTKGKERIAYPNPFVETLHLEKAENVKKAVITDLSGVMVKTVENPSSDLFLGDVKSGMYILTLTMKDGSVKSMKTIKK
ncbi:T9SS type A sorting domain-containing protein [Chryseobacterium sp. SSA4.19]|uniref:T9SS type A sorting domain-containing protein n=1 Tax=Chryseobacterium sp. SSA4.19 TaxID=2919915 RepID=UPI001F4DFDDA|nr:T9SS type A sorting domain-containing protein [Chryseobacterium sp. SSA4.19]MCJ8154283.1 T9SS type A sorting domain-containing protein [Chryseobacterium sp. SSA4.19]